MVRFLLVLVLILATDEVAAQDITVTPAGPPIAVGQTRQFTATGIDAATAVEAGAFHQCALLQDSTVRCWGENVYGQLGNGTFTSAPNPTPVAVAGIAGAAAVTGGGFHSCARFPDGTLRCWGRNLEGQLGNPAMTDWMSGTPVPVTDITTATAVTAGAYHTCALLQNGTVRCWGLNDFGQLGNGVRDSPPTPNRSPAAVSGITNAIAISAGGWHTCALLQNGTVRCWGRNDYGAVGDGAIITPQTRPQPIPRPVPSPAEVMGIATAVAIKAGIFDTCALLQDGTMRCWGWNDFLQLGDPTAINASSTPVTVPGITPAALSPGAEFTCGLLPDATVRCWGWNDFGQLGNGSPGGVFLPPTAAVTGIATATALTSGAEHTCALLVGGRVQCWGRGFFGALGNGATTDAFTPATVLGLGVTWTSSDPSVASIDASGSATGRNPGSTTITATSGGRSGSTTLTVVSNGNGDPTLSVIREGTGSGTVTSAEIPTRINCGTTCSAGYDSGTAVTLTASPAPGSIFEGWRGAGLPRAETTTVNFDTPVPPGTLSGIFRGIDFGAGQWAWEGAYDISPTNHIYFADSTGTSRTFGFSPAPRILNGMSVFSLAPGTLTLTDDAGQTLSQQVTPGSMQLVTTGWTRPSATVIVSFTAGWNLGLDDITHSAATPDGGCGGAGTCTVTVTTNTAVFARFSVPSFTLSVVSQGPGSGLVTSAEIPPRIDCGATCTASYDRGTTVTLTATPFPGSTFEGWTGSSLLGAQTTVNFDTPTPPGTLNGMFQGIDFGAGQWAWEGAYDINPTNHIYFADSTGTSRTFGFSPAPRILNSTSVFSLAPGTLTLADDGGQTLSRLVTPGSMQLVTTGWTRPSATVTVSFTAGWNLGLDDITHSAASPDSGCGSASGCAVTVTTNTTVFARFGAPSLTLSGPLTIPAAAP